MRAHKRVMGRVEWSWGGCLRPRRPLNIVRSRRQLALSRPARRALRSIVLPIEVELMFPSALRREILALLCIKALALVAIYQLFFAPITRTEPDGHAMRTHLLTTDVSRNR